MIFIYSGRSSEEANLCVVKARDVVEREQRKANKLLSDCAAPFKRVLSMFNLRFKQSSKNYHKNFSIIICFSHFFYDSKNFNLDENFFFFRPSNILK